MADNLEGIVKLNKDIKQNGTKFGIKTGIFIIRVMACGFGEDAPVYIPDDPDSINLSKNFGSGELDINQEQKAISDGWKVFIYEKHCSFFLPIVG